MRQATARQITFYLILTIVALMVVSCTTLPSDPPADAVKADIGFPSVGTKWVTKTVSHTGIHTGIAWTATFTVLHEGTYKGTPVYRVSDGVNILMFDKATRNWIAAVRAGTERSAASPYHPTYSFPLWVGKSWVANYKYFDGDRERTFFHVPWRAKVTAYEDVTVPAGTFKAFKVEGGDPGGRIDVWYSPELKVNVKSILERFPGHYIGSGKYTTEVIEYSAKSTVQRTEIHTQTPILKEIPPAYTIPYGGIVYVENDGRCSQGEVIKITGGYAERGIPRKYECVKHPE